MADGDALDRRGFIGKLGAAAAVIHPAFHPAFHLGSRHAAEAASIPLEPIEKYFVNRDGTMGPVSGKALSTGAVPSTQLFTKRADGFAPTSHATQYNVFMIMVDQMRKPRWFPPQFTGEAQFLQAITPNIFQNIYRNAFNFSNYYTAATNCTPARATILTGLYPQQTCMFDSDTASDSPTLIPANSSAAVPLAGPQIGFPTFANALTNLDQWATGDDVALQNYNCAWVGKWHVSAENTGQSCDLGPFGFGQNAESLPTNAPAVPFHSTRGKIPSPIGWANEANTGGQISGLSQSYVSDYDIFYFLDHVWLPNMVKNGPSQAPWLCCASFINPHDISSFPSYYNFPASGASCIAPQAANADTCPYGTGAVACALMERTETSIPPYHYAAPSAAGYDGRTSPTNPQFYPALADFSPYTAANFTTGSPSAILNWNGFDALTSYEGGGFSGTGSPGKPDFQTGYLKSYQASNGGVVPNCLNTSTLWPSGWATFMNYYAWMHGCVDSIIGMIFGAGLNATDTPVWGASLGTNSQGANVTTATNTMIVFLADHGEYGGSHEMQNKGGAAYDESIHVPLYILYPGQSSPQTFNEMVSSVDLMPFLLTTASLRQSWRNTSLGGPFTYLAGRESIFDIIFEQATYKPVRTVPVVDSFGNTVTLPFILHTFDEAVSPGAGQPPQSHVLCMRTGIGADSMGHPFGGKLVKYDSWPCNSRIPSPTQAGGYHGQYEFYNYGSGSVVPGGNLNETGNEVMLANWTPTASSASGRFLAGMTAVIQNEFYSVPAVFLGESCNGPWYTAFAAYQTVADAWCGAINCPGPLTTTPWP